MSEIRAITPNCYKKNFIHVPIIQTKEQSPSLNKNDFIEAQFNWLTNETLKSALRELYYCKFDIKDVAKIESMGLELPFSSGEEVVNFLAAKNVRINFENIKENDIHACYDFEKNVITINERYKNTHSKPVILAIASAILHEAGHAKDKDGITSIQEELECLALNSIAHRAFIRKNPDIFKNVAQPIIQDGVGLYSELFFERPSSNDLALRVKIKYGELPVGCKKHKPSDLALKIKYL